MFQENSRVEKKDGIRFYEQDVLCSNYVFSGDMVIDLRVDYLYPGMGILLAIDNGKPVSEADHVYLFKTGDNDFRVIERHYTEQSMPDEGSCAFAASDTNVNAHIVFSKKGQLITMSLAVNNATTGAQELMELGHYTIKKTIDKYRIGFYSNAGNTLKYATVASGIPKNWLVNVKNTNGGRISFFKNGFMIEECEYDAEIEQQEVLLNAGTYYVGFEKKPINGKNDIECFVFASTDGHFDDDKKSILKDGKFVLKKNGKINIKFKGTSGKISDICIKDLEDSAYVETDLEQVVQDGSYITVNLTRLKSVRWKGTISALPEYKDFTKECPYGIIVTKTQRLTKNMANIDLNKEYLYTYTVATKQLIIQREGDLYKTINVDLREADENKLIVFKNMSAIIRELIIVDDEGQEIDVLLQKTFRKYVPSTINGPIIITDEENSPFNLSSSYREVVTPVWDIELFSQNNAIDLKHRILNEGECIFVYGIPAGATVHMNRRDSIEEFSDQYSLLKASTYSVDYDKNIVVVNSNIRNLYKHIAVCYQQADKFSYLFTNYEREVFQDTRAAIIPEKNISDMPGGVRVYGIPIGTETHDEYIYRVPRKTMVNSIDLYASKYDIISELEYKINYERPEIELSVELRTLYKAFVVDYLKSNSYCINYLPDYGQYEVDISIDTDHAHMIYDMGENGTVSDYKITAIKPDKSKYIILRKVQEGLD